MPPLRMTGLYLDGNGSNKSLQFWSLTPSGLKVAPLLPLFLCRVSVDGPPRQPQPNEFLRSKLLSIKPGQTFLTNQQQNTWSSAGSLKFSQARLG